MAFPRHLVLVRHGESEGNIAQERELRDDASCYAQAHLARHTSTYRLTLRGVAQSRAAGAWLKWSGLGAFDRAYVSEYMRAIETAGNLGLENAIWTINDALHERDSGLLNSVPWAERHARFPDHRQLELASCFFGSPPEGESLADVRIRLRAGFMPLLESRDPPQRVIVVGHGNALRVLRGIIEQVPFWVYEEHKRAHHPDHKMHNAHILHYTRVHPDDPLCVTPDFGWVRSVCPWDETLTDPSWRRIERPPIANEDLLMIAERFPRIME